MSEQKKTTIQTPISLDLKMVSDKFPELGVVKVRDLPDPEFLDGPFIVDNKKVGTIIKIERSIASNTAWLTVQLDEQYVLELKGKLGGPLVGVVLFE
jgi:hypothetical protein